MMPTMRAQSLTALEAGRALFNARRFFDAHEAWEAAWLTETGPDKLLLQGLIIAAAGCHKVTVAEPRGAVKLLSRALELLAPFPDDAAQLPLANFRAELTSLLDHTRAWHSGSAAQPIPSFPL
jgi:predicted metal-dependent hydrolase